MPQRPPAPGRVTVRPGRLGAGAPGPDYRRRRDRRLAAQDASARFEFPAEIAPTDVDFAGTSVGASATTADFLRTAQLAGSSASAGVTTGAAQRGAALAGASAGTGGTTGTTARVAGLAGTSAAAATSTGRLMTPFAGVSAGAGASTGTLTPRRGFTASSVGSSAASGVIDAQIGFEAVSVGASETDSEGFWLDPAALAATSTGVSAMTGVLVAPISGTAFGSSTTAGGLRVTWALAAADSTSIGQTGDPVRPGLALIPTGNLFPGFRGSELTVTLPFAGVSVGVSATRAGETTFAGVSAGASDMGSLQSPGTVLPGGTVYPGLVRAALTNTVAIPGATSAGTSATTGLVAVAVTVTAASAGGGSTSAAVVRIATTAGTSEGVSDASGNLRLESELALFDTASVGVSDTAGEILAVYALEGVSEGIGVTDALALEGGQYVPTVLGWIEVGTDTGSEGDAVGVTGAADAVEFVGAAETADFATSTRG